MNRQSGKTNLTMIMARRIITEGGKVAFVSHRPDGQQHVCVVQSIKTAHRKPSNKAH